jgi:hypothetical protein
MQTNAKTQQAQIGLPEHAQLKPSLGPRNTGAARIATEAANELRRVSERVMLDAAQLAIARHYGFASWAKLRDGSSPPAALLFAVAFGAFLTSKIIITKELGLGTAAAVLLDATIVRAMLVPALMRLLGRWNWWAPAPLRRLHDRLRPQLGEA